MCNKVFSLKFGMANSNPSLFLGNVQCKLVKQYRNSVFYSIFCIATVTINLLEILQMLPEMRLACALKCFPSILVWAIQICPSLFLGHVQWKLVKQYKNSDF